uniref:Uncharacterized protein LOC104233766 n=1 Tax=Nicotiana sylvestris TaxID=4096 RepID=A0A1U7XGD3_NICSY|nr:PREDICTED: uncharacterized protein LOC104233766 [Nicotiana sylvestris]
MEIYAKAYDVKVWRVIKKGNYPLPATAQPLADPEDIDSYTDEQMAVVFSKIISNLKAFGKPYSGGDQVRKILRFLPTTRQTKVFTLESQDLNKLSYDELHGEFIAFEKTHIKKINQEEKKKIVAFKATTKITENDINDDPEALQEEIARMSRNMYGLMRRFRNTRRGRIPPRRTRKYNEQDKNDGKYYDCGRFGHIQAKCPDLKRKISRGFNKNKSFGSWSDEDNSKHEEDARQTRTFQTMNAKITMKTASWLEDILNLTLKESQKMMDELKSLNKEVKDWKIKHEVCEIEKEVLQEKFEELQMQLNGMRKSTSHSSIRSNQTTYKSTGKGPARTESTSTNTTERPKMGQELHVTTAIKVDINLLIIVFISLIFQNGFGNPKMMLNLVTLTNQNPSKLGYLKESDHYALQEHYRRNRKGKWYLDSVVPAT